VLVSLAPEEFSKILRRIENPLVVSAQAASLQRTINTW